MTGIMEFASHAGANRKTGRSTTKRPLNVAVLPAVLRTLGREDGELGAELPRLAGTE